MCIRDSFVGDLRRTDVCLDLELPQEAVNDDLQMKLTHAGDDRRAGLFIGVGLYVYKRQAQDIVF